MTRSGRPYHHGELRRDLLGAARQLLDEGGPAALTLREAARRVGVAAPSAYHHFPNLDALAADVAAEGFAELAATLEAAPTDAQGRLGPAGEAYINWARANPGLYRLMFGEKFRQAVEASNGVQDGRTRTHELLVGGLAKRHLDTDLATAALFAWALVHGLATLLIDDPSNATMAARIPDVFRLAARGIPLGPPVRDAEGRP